MRTKLSVLQPAFNSAEIIRPTLESIRWVDEILVVDSFSTDATLDVCREYGARIIQLEYIQSAKQKNWAIPSTLTSGCYKSIRTKCWKPARKKRLSREARWRRLMFSVFVAAQESRSREVD